MLSVTANERAGPLPRPWGIALVVLCLGTVWLQCRLITQTSPYPIHVDEGFVSGPAYRTVTTGNFHPYTFNYPSLPKYIAAAGMAAGFIRGATRGDMADILRVGNPGYPYYGHPRMLVTARELYALLASVAAAATGWMAWMVTRRAPTIVLAPLILVASPLFFYHSWAYLNVDIIGACFTTLALAFVVRATERPTLVRSAVVPALLAGLAAGSKYTVAVVLASVLAGILLFPPERRRLYPMAVAAGTAALAFLVAVPYSLLDLPGFVNGLAFEAFHYASGHRGFQDAPGWPQARYYGAHFLSEFGGGLLLAIAGLLFCARRQPRVTAILLLFPAVLMWLLIAQRVHFERNVVSLHPIVALFAAAGAVGVYDLALPALRARGADGRLPRWAWAAVVLLIAVPVWHLRDHWRDQTDSRTRATRWMEADLPADWAIVLPEELGLDPRPLRGAGRNVIEFHLQKTLTPDAVRQALAEVPSPAVILVPRFGADDRFRGADVAPALNQLTASWRVLRRYEGNDVLVNYSHPVPSGNPAFAIAVIK